MARLRIGREERERRKALGKRFSDAMEARGISQRQLWMLMLEQGVPGVRDRSTVVKVLQGKTRASAEFVSAAGSILGISLALLLDRHAEMENDGLKLRYHPWDVESTKDLPELRRAAVLRFAAFLDDAPIRPGPRRNQMSKPFVSRAERHELLRGAADHLLRNEESIKQVQEDYKSAQLPDGFAYMRWADGIIQSYVFTLHAS